MRITKGTYLFAHYLTVIPLVLCILLIVGAAVLIPLLDHFSLEFISKLQVFITLVPPVLLGIFMGISKYAIEGFRQNRLEIIKPRESE